MVWKIVRGNDNDDFAVWKELRLRWLAEPPCGFLGHSPLVIYILHDKEGPQHVCIVPHIIHSSIRPMKQTSHWLIIRLSGQPGSGGFKRSLKEILEFVFFPVFCHSHLWDQVVAQYCDSLTPSTSFLSLKLEQSQCSFLQMLINTMIYW